MSPLCFDSILLWCAFKQVLVQYLTLTEGLVAQRMLKFMVVEMDKVVDKVADMVVDMEFYKVAYEVVVWV